MVAVAAGAGAAAATPPYRRRNTNDNAHLQMHGQACKIQPEFEVQMLHLAAAD